jgi:UbiD family decarboxylase
MPEPPPHDLRSFLDRLRRTGDVIEVTAPVNAELEVPEIHRRVIAAGGPALLFSNVEGSPFRLVSNLFGTAERVKAAFGSEPRRIVERVAGLPEELMPPSLSGLWKQRDLFTRLARVGTRTRARGPVTEVVDRPPALGRLPATKSWIRDGGRFLTLPLVYTEPPHGGPPNLGMYRIQLFDDETTGLHCQIGKGGGFHLAQAAEAGRALEVVINMGGPPAAILGAIAPLPENVPELLLTSLAAGKRLPLARNPAGSLPVIADAEMCLVGEVDPAERRPEGPFGDHYGYYSETHDYPVFRCRALLRRKDAILPATVVGKPRQEDFFLGDFLQELLAPLFPLVMPGVVDLWSYGETGYHSLGAAIVRERYKREAMASAFRILGEGQLSLTKFLLLTDGAVDLRDFPAVLEHVLARADFRTDLFLLSNLSMDSLDYAGPRIDEGSKGVLLGLGDPIRELPRELTTAPAAPARDARPFCAGCLVVGAPPHDAEPDVAERIARDPALADWPLVVLTDEPERAARSPMNFLWTTFTRFDPARDVTAARTELVHAHASMTPPIVIDARRKAWYPEELFCDPDTASRVDRRWSEYFPAGGVEMGDSDRAHLD